MTEVDEAFQPLFDLMGEVAALPTTADQPDIPNDVMLDEIIVKARAWLVTARAIHKAAD